MEFLLALEPLTALAVGVGALVVVPVVAAVGAAVSEPLAESGKNLAKSGLALGFDVFDKTQNFFAETSESFQDLVAEAKAEHLANKAKAQDNSHLN
jgi:hypothetical protein